MELVKKNPLSASENNQEHCELLFKMTYYLVKSGIDQYSKYPSCLHGYALAIKDLWKDQTPNGYGYISEKIAGVLGAIDNFLYESNSDEEHKHWLSVAFQDFYKIAMGVSMLNNQRKMRLAEEREAKNAEND